MQTKWPATPFALRHRTVATKVQNRLRLRRPYILREYFPTVVPCQNEYIRHAYTIASFKPNSVYIDRYRLCFDIAYAIDEI